jgi:hypothetical protein
MAGRTLAGSGLGFDQGQAKHPVDVTLGSVA